MMAIIIVIIAAARFSLAVSFRVTASSQAVCEDASALGAEPSNGWGALKMISRTSSRTINPHELCILTAIVEHILNPAGEFRQNSSGKQQIYPGKYQCADNYRD